MPTLTIPDAAYRRLAERAVAQNTTVDDLAARLLDEDSAGSPVPLDTEYHTECAADAGPKPTPPEAPAPRTPGRGKGKLVIHSDDDEHLADFAEYL